MSVYMKLLVVISLILTLNHVVVHSARIRRSEPLELTDEQKSDIVMKHNALRAREFAADMELMTWNESLAEEAAIRAAQCEKYDKYDKFVAMHRGQNVFMMIDDKTKLVGIIQEWYNEKTNYHYNKGCTGMCSHYTQVVWATSRQVGCAYHKCDMKDSGFKQAEFFACNYKPAGNLMAQKPYKEGPPCSKCEGGAGWCKKGLCNRQCSTAGKDCSCRAVCHNCATLDIKTCRCSCTDGWYGADCSEPCKERSGLCNPSYFKVGPPLSLCEHRNLGSWAKRNCPVMCGLCKRNRDVKENKCEPVYAPGTSALAMFVDPTGNDDDGNGSQHQQQRITLTLLLSCIILSLTITWKVLL